MLKMGISSALFHFLLFTTLCHTVKELQEDCESVTLVQASQIFLGLVPKNKEKKKSKYMNLACFGKGAGKYERSEVERILYHMILRQYLGETVILAVEEYRNTDLK